jgi:hypothetical protein
MQTEANRTAKRAEVASLGIAVPRGSYQVSGLRLPDQKYRVQQESY